MSSFLWSGPRPYRWCARYLFLRHRFVQGGQITWEGQRRNVLRAEYIEDDLDCVFAVHDGDFVARRIPTAHFFRGGGGSGFLSLRSFSSSSNSLRAISWKR